MNPHRWLHEHSLKVLAIRDTPEAIAGGVAIGIFIGFTPLFGLKTVLTILFAWLTGSNIIAAVIASAAHDILWPVMPVIFRWEYDVGFWLLSQPHHWPESFTKMDLHGQSWRRWSRIGTFADFQGLATELWDIFWFVHFRGQYILRFPILYTARRWRFQRPRAALPSPKSKTSRPA